MKTELRITPPAAQDMRDAYMWYEEQRLGLGEAFLLRLEARLEAIRRMPERFERVHRNFRRALVRRYPFAIFFEYDGNGLLDRAYRPGRAKVAGSIAVTLADC